MTGSYSAKQLRFTFWLSSTDATFNGSDNTLQITGLRAIADINYPGPGTSFPSVTAQIYGMAQSDMNALTSMTADVFATARNSVQIETNDGSGWQTVFAGQITNAFPDYDAMPNVSFILQAQVLFFEQLDPATPSSFASGASYESVFSTIAAKMNRTLINDGVTGNFVGARYFPGTLTNQLRAAAKQANVNFYTDQEALSNGATVPANTLTITPVGTALSSLTAFKLTPDTGLIGYPKPLSFFLIMGRSIYNPALKSGAPLHISQSEVPTCNGDWIIFAVRHRLSSLLPDGPWFTEFTAQPSAAAYKYQAG